MYQRNMETKNMMSETTRIHATFLSGASKKLPPSVDSLHVHKKLSPSPESLTLEIVVVSFGFANVIREESRK